MQNNKHFTHTSTVWSSRDAVLIYYVFIMIYIGSTLHHRLKELCLYHDIYWEHPSSQAKELSAIILAPVDSLHNTELSMPESTRQL